MKPSDSSRKASGGAASFAASARLSASRLDAAITTSTPRWCDCSWMFPGNDASMGFRLDADNPKNGVLVPCRLTACAHPAWARPRLPSHSRSVVPASIGFRRWMFHASQVQLGCHPRRKSTLTHYSAHMIRFLPPPPACSVGAREACGHILLKNK